MKLNEQYTDMFYTRMGKLQPIVVTHVSSYEKANLMEDYAVTTA